MPETLRQLWTGLRALVVFTVLLGIAYPVAIWGIGSVAFPGQSRGSLVVVDDQVRGSAQIGQAFAGSGWFQPRLSAGDYDAQASGGSNAGPNDPDLAERTASSRAEIAARERVAPSAVPADAVTASASGLDAYISPTYAALQVPRVARERGLSPAAVAELVAANTHGRSLGFLGQPRVDVVSLNAAVAGS